MQRDDHALKSSNVVYMKAQRSSHEPSSATAVLLILAAIPRVLVCAAWAWLRRVVQA